MKIPHTHAALLSALFTLTAPAVLAQQVPDPLPEGVSAAMISEGAAVYKAQGICFVCHGPEAKGMPNLGANLTDKEWAHSDGSYEGILKTIKAGAQAKSGAVMPPDGGASLSDAQRAAVAAYVWSLGRAAGSDLHRR